MKHYLIFAKLFFLFAITGLLACTEKSPDLTLLDANAVILAYGDSLTYGTGANHDTESYPAILAQLTMRTVINEGVPGEISADGLKRLPSVLKRTRPDLVILCHGGNDLIRQLDRGQLKNNLNQMITLIKASGAQVVLVGVPSFNLLLKVPELYKQLADENGLPVDLDTIREIEIQPKLKSDQIHPNAQGYKIIAQQLYQLLQEFGAV